jgi:hypothetical protein
MSIPSQRQAPASLPAHAIPTTDLKRRRFLLALGAGSAGAAAVATQSIATPLVEAPPAAAPQESQGYRETQHIRDYYATTRI